MSTVDDAPALANHAVQGPGGRFVFFTNLRSLKWLRPEDLPEPPPVYINAADVTTIRVHQSRDDWTMMKVGTTWCEVPLPLATVVELVTGTADTEACQ